MAATAPRKPSKTVVKTERGVCSTHPKQSLDSNRRTTLNVRALSGKMMKRVTDRHPPYENLLIGMKED
ncbi:hypothetical protein HDF09_002032 [Edaphobacter lichenicola]|uniref:Uncharacterized protein n=1 Tax=Tunturiibacter empetritectus TaxID=3069691 RepID=A0A7W8IJJ2_9BACT|nr:hypothetical protein [Edaphobacter lichenicola]